MGNCRKSKTPKNSFKSWDARRTALARSPLTISLTARVVDVNAPATVEIRGISRQREAVLGRSIARHN